MSNSNDNGYVYSRRLDRDRLQTLLETRRGELAYAMQETDADIAFEAISVLDRPWSRGRVFGETLEVRWAQEDDGRYRVLVLAETPQPTLAEAGWRVRAGLAAEDEVRVYLWGRHYSSLRGGQPEGLPHRWVQASIPRELKYPWPEKDEWVYLQAVEYRENGVVRLTRFKGLGGETRGGGG